MSYKQLMYMVLLEVSSSVRSRLIAFDRERGKLFSQPWEPRMTVLQLAAAFHGFEHRNLVGVFDIAADRDSHRNARHFEPGAP
jgi:hypothetical protein